MLEIRVLLRSSQSCFPFRFVLAGLLRGFLLGLRRASSLVSMLFYPLRFTFLLRRRFRVGFRFGCCRRLFLFALYLRVFRCVPRIKDLGSQKSPKSQHSCLSYPLVVIGVDVSLDQNSHCTSSSSSSSNLRRCEIGTGAGEDEEEEELSSSSSIFIKFPSPPQDISNIPWNENIHIISSRSINK